MAGRAVAVTLVGVVGALAVTWTLLAPTEVDEDRVESGTLSELDAAPGDHLDCDGGLKAEVGSAQHCTLTSEGEKFTVKLRVTGVDGDNVRWDSVVDRDPQAGRRVTPAQLERHTKHVLAQRGPVDTVQCAGGLPATVGAAQDCTATARGATQLVRTVVTSVDPARVQWSVTVVG
ncbi:hypothetical protein TPAU25S_01216 [Tsukamurella paurometabola]|uniref:DUF4333 domain-containing protein n=1 Tax=Tsukamurella paurometabola (strain ATCC 8368 / DSM 20162 / CCUG 35730 / CIP 100753 / JCM 10117 / KCTC 9821 / NBRC 16120 / NCIMB 702349 / NCTC 13040) TaxID=521096 RepID=D5UUC3_TSUPD|nr:DUF4333 domain-containing protein [Tsukamurella paurometabola]ADG77494.1 hypothetical protein Tpau_0859 [Tsukamurella paurometabola DSM 20162]SUP27398.1 Uncharacterised protein [Tsukamurella paurometabola]